MLNITKTSSVHSFSPEFYQHDLIRLFYATLKALILIAVGSPEGKRGQSPQIGIHYVVAAQVKIACIVLSSFDQNQIIFRYYDTCKALTFNLIISER